MAKQLEMMYEGKAKQVFATDDPTLAVIHYKDDATAFNGLKKGTIVGKGVVNNLVSNHLFKMLEANGVKTHLVEQLNERDSVVRRVSIVPLEVIVRNIAAGSLSKRLGLPEGTKLKTTVLEYCYKNDDLGDPMINDYHIAAMELATKDEMAQIAAMALKVNELLTAYLKDLGIELIDFKLEFGRFNGEILLADEINRATPKSQSALLEAMQEHTVTVDGKDYRMEEPFFVLATQNPIEQEGTYPLPEAQLDRFLLCLSLGYPEREQELALLSRPMTMPVPVPVISAQQIVAARRELEQVAGVMEAREFLHRARLSGGLVTGHGEIVLEDSLEAAFDRVGNGYVVTDRRDMLEDKGKNQAELLVEALGAQPSAGGCPPCRRFRSAQQNTCQP